MTQLLQFVVRYTEAHQALEEAAAAAAELAQQATGHPNKGAPFLSAPRTPGVPQELALLHCTALHLAATYGHAQAVQALLTSPTCSTAACNAMVGYQSIRITHSQQQTLLQIVLDADSVGCRQLKRVGIFPVLETALNGAHTKKPVGWSNLWCMHVQRVSCCCAGHYSAAGCSQGGVGGCGGYSGE